MDSTGGCGDGAEVVPFPVGEKGSPGAGKIVGPARKIAFATTRDDYFASSIFWTWMDLLFASSVPVTVTFLAANLAGDF
jgi:hypothetical protein